MTICALQNKTSYELALRKLDGSGVSRWLRGPLHGVAEIYIPYRLYKVTLSDRGVQSSRHYALDAATGTLDPYEFLTPPGEEALVEVQTRNVHPAMLDEDESKSLALEKVRRLLFSRGFFRIVNPKITAELVKPEFHIPYWVGFYGGEQNVKVAVLDGIRQTVEGSKARRIVEAWVRGVPPRIACTVRP